MKRDYDRIIYAADGLAARAAYDAFVKKWSALCTAVATSLEEAGPELLTFYDFPKSTWKSIRTTNMLENLHREFRRRTKTQASFGTEDGALTSCMGSSPLDRFSSAASMAISTCRRLWRRRGGTSREDVEWSTVQQERCA
jgi:hypothetical protein